MTGDALGPGAELMRSSTCDLTLHAAFTDLSPTEGGSDPPALVFLAHADAQGRQLKCSL